MNVRSRPQIIIVVVVVVVVFVVIIALVILTFCRQRISASILNAQKMVYC